MWRIEASKPKNRILVAGNRVTCSFPRLNSRVGNTLSVYAVTRPLRIVPTVPTQIGRTLGDFWLLIPGPARRGTLHDETGVKYDCSGIADEANSKQFQQTAT